MKIKTLAASLALASGLAAAPPVIAQTVDQLQPSVRLYEVVENPDGTSSRYDGALFVVGRGEYGSIRNAFRACLTSARQLACGGGAPDYCAPFDQRVRFECVQGFEQ